MIQRLSHATIYVLDQEEARQFYVDKLGFTIHTDVTMDGGFRWLTVSPPGQPELEIILMGTQPDGHMWDEQTSAAIRELVKNGKIGAGVFETSDCRKTYEELKAKGVEFLKEPTDEFYGTECIFKDNSGNWFSLGQK